MLATPKGNKLELPNSSSKKPRRKRAQSNPANVLKRQRLGGSPADLTIFSASIREDLPAVRTATVEVAKTSATIRSMYDKHDLQESIHKRFPGGFTKGRRSKIGSRWS